MPSDKNTPVPPKNDDRKSKSGIWIPLLISVAVILTISWVYNALSSMRYTQTTYSDFRDTMESGQLAEVDLHFDRIIYLTKQEAAKPESIRKACYTGIPSYADTITLMYELDELGMDALAARSTVGLVSNVPEGMVPESDTANLAILSYNPLVYSKGRSPLEAMSMGLTNIKFFPAEANGGVNKLKALAGPYQAAKWMPTGGVNTKNLNDYLSFDRILCCGGTWIATSADINEGKWDDITRKCKEAIKTMLGFKLEKICIYGDSANAEKNAQFVASLFGFDTAETECGYQAGGLCFAKEESDAKGCIVISTLNGDRAMSYLKRMGAEIDPDIWYDKKGKVSCFGLKDLVAGFEICIETK